jgi:hypothetical protein
MSDARPMWLSERAQDAITNVLYEHVHELEREIFPPEQIEESWNVIREWNLSSLESHLNRNDLKRINEERMEGLWDE